MKNRLLTLFLVGIALAGTTSYATTSRGTESPQQMVPSAEAQEAEWNPDVIADSSDPGLAMVPQGASTPSLIDPGCSPCVAAMMQARLGDRTGVSARTSTLPLGPTGSASEGQQ